MRVEQLDDMTERQIRDIPTDVLANLYAHAENQMNIALRRQRSIVAALNNNLCIHRGGISHREEAGLSITANVGPLGTYYTFKKLKKRG